MVVLLVGHLVRWQTPRYGSNLSQSGHNLPPSRGMVRALHHSLCHSWSATDDLVVCYGLVQGFKPIGYGLALFACSTGEFNVGYGPTSGERKPLHNESCYRAPLPAWQCRMWLNHSISQVLSADLGLARPIGLGLTQVLPAP
jgi:hypothetical protein